MGRFLVFPIPAVTFNFQNPSPTPAYPVTLFKGMLGWFFTFLKYRTMDRIQKTSNSECYTSSSGHFNISQRLPGSVTLYSLRWKGAIHLSDFQAEEYPSFLTTYIKRYSPFPSYTAYQKPLSSVRNLTAYFAMVSRNPLNFERVMNVRWKNCFILRNFKSLCTEPRRNKLLW
jgi:hypothetical protein